MHVLFGLTHRHLVPEDMDDPAIDTSHLHGALHGLMRLNAVANSARIVWRPIPYVARRLKTDRLKVLDIATGAGDIPISVWQRAKRRGLVLEILGIDVNSRSIDFARRQAAAANVPIQFETKNALIDDLPGGFDIVMCSLFLHHLATDDAVVLLRKMAAATTCAGIVSDLRRSAYGLALAFAASRLLSRSPVVHVDAVRSVRAAFTIDELGCLAEQAGVSRFRAGRQWPARMSLVWYRSSTE